MRDKDIGAVLPPGEFTLMAGPCSAESREQLLRTAGFFADYNARNPQLPVRVFRAGVWKPRTRPGSFEGMGEQALAWLAEVRETYRLPVSTEVATARHVELCLRHGIDQLWIGARTTANPFLMEEISQALQGCGNPVWVKNPISPDLALWLGAIERVSRHSKGKVGAIHRGFGMYNSLPYRNSPLWEIAVEMKRSHPEIPLLCDPSHMGGKRAYLPELAQNGLDLEMDGLMLEVHPSPAEAMSDAAQQVDFEGFEQLLSGLVFRKAGCSSVKMAQIRHILDEVDDELIQVLARRMQLVKELGRLKKEENLSVLQFDRWNEVVKRMASLAERQGLDKEFVQQILNCLHAEAIRVQKDMLRGKD
ncbi:MAG: bifunctional 3-deoxy-7-phosphoheptulonate synthase/chorismate mutase type II [Bacteroides sp.]|nr:bifunctional 3-deoxy-7-phosphoheptulonate synthase/chorismate mutase type II [Bacteroides sp.]